MCEYVRIETDKQITDLRNENKRGTKGYITAEGYVTAILDWYSHPSIVGFRTVKLSGQAIHASEATKQLFFCEKNFSIIF